MNLLQLTIELSERGHSVEYITFVLRKTMREMGKTEEQIALLIGGFNGNN